MNFEEHQEAWRQNKMQAALKKLPCVKVSRPDSHGNLWCLYEAEKFSAADEFDGAEVGERIILEYCEMTKEELTALPEFCGW